MPGRDGIPGEDVREAKLDLRADPQLRLGAGRSVAVDGVGQQRRRGVRVGEQRRQPGDVAGVGEQPGVAQRLRDARALGGPLLGIGTVALEGSNVAEGGEGLGPQRRRGRLGLGDSAEPDPALGEQDAHSRGATTGRPLHLLAEQHRLLDEPGQRVEDVPGGQPVVPADRLGRGRGEPAREPTPAATAAVPRASRGRSSSRWWRAGSGDVPARACRRGSIV
jgi:hypothetical protein